MTTALLKAICWTVALGASAVAGPDNEFIDELHILPKLMQEAQRAGEPLRTEVLRNNAGREYHYFMSTAHFVGQFDAPFGRVYVAQFAFTRSEERGSKLHSRHYGYLAFLDDKFRLRHYWFLSQPSPLAHGSRSAMMLERAELLDFNKMPESGKLIIDGSQVDVPRW